ncbi:MAG: phenylalanine--tRNA ligase beta subunit-related protein [Candidatus Methylomirabilia bacterium]
MRNVANPPRHSALDRCIDEFENEIRARFAGADRAALRALPPLNAYAAYYKRFTKTYHVQLQLESAVLKGKAMPRGPALVATMVMAELKNLLLTAAHDLAALQLPVALDVATGRERYILLSGQEQEAKPGDMLMADAQGVISSVVHGPDRRTRVTSDTREALFAVYAPPGIGELAVSQHLQDIVATVLLVAPEAEVDSLMVYGAQ